jgi:hypothetical protein
VATAPPNHAGDNSDCRNGDDTEKFTVGTHDSYVPEIAHVSNGGVY